VAGINAVCRIGIVAAEQRSEYGKVRGVALADVVALLFQMMSLI